MRHPLLGDKEYAGEQRGNPIFRAVPRQMLHACRLILPDPQNEKALRISAPVPEDFQAVLHALKLK
jgi:23S rRNA pseudouridine1911/1915/1917 synthase